MIDNAAANPNEDARNPISKWPNGAVPMASSQAPIARPRNSLDTHNCIMLCDNTSGEAVATATINNAIIVIYTI